MSNCYLVIKPGKHDDIAEFQPGILLKPPTLEFKQKLVEGPIQLIPRFNFWQGKPCVAICNEEGTMKKLPINLTATEAWRFITCTNDFLVGNVAIFQGSDNFLQSIL